MAAVEATLAAECEANGAAATQGGDATASAPSHGGVGSAGFGDKVDVFAALR